MGQYRLTHVLGGYPQLRQMPVLIAYYSGPPTNQGWGYWGSFLKLGSKCISSKSNLRDICPSGGTHSKLAWFNWGWVTYEAWMPRVLIIMPRVNCFPLRDTSVPRVCQGQGYIRARDRGFTSLGNIQPKDCNPNMKLMYGARDSLPMSLQHTLLSGLGNIHHKQFNQHNTP